MANTYTFTSVTNGQAKFKKNSEFWHIIEEEDKLDQTGATAMRMHNHNGQYDINLAVDTVIINGTTYAPGSDFDTVYDALNPLFHKANTGSGGTGEVPNLQAVTSAGGQTSNPIYLQDADVNVLGDEGALLSSLSYDADGGIVTLKDVNTGFVATLRAPQGMTANRDVYVGASGLVSTWVDTDGFEWGIVGVTTSGGLITEKVTVDAGAGTERSWVDDNGDRWAITGIGTDGHLITNKI